MAHQRTWTVEDVRALGVTTDLETAASVLGIGRTKAYEMASVDEFPVAVIRSGRSYRVAVPAILSVLGVVVSLELAVAT